MNVFLSRGKQVITIASAAKALDSNNTSVRKALARHTQEEDSWTLKGQELIDCLASSSASDMSSRAKIRHMRVLTVDALSILATKMRSETARALVEGMRAAYMAQRQEHYTAPAALPAPAATPELPVSFDNSPALQHVAERLDGMQRQINMLASSVGTAFPPGYMPYRQLAKKSGLTEAVCHRLVTAWGVPTAQGQTVAPSGICVPTSCAEAVGFQAALYQMMGEAERHGDSNRWSHPKIGSRFQALGWPREPKF